MYDLSVEISRRGVSIFVLHRDGQREEVARVKPGDQLPESHPVGVMYSPTMTPDRLPHAIYQAGDAFVREDIAEESILPNFRRLLEFAAVHERAIATLLVAVASCIAQRELWVGAIEFDEVDERVHVLLRQSEEQAGKGKINLRGDEQ